MAGTVLNVEPLLVLIVSRVELERNMMQAISFTSNIAYEIITPHLLRWQTAITIYLYG